MPKPLTPWAVAQFKGENDAVPAIEIDETQGALVKNFYLVNGGLERRRGVARASTNLGVNQPVQGLQWFRTDPNWGTAGTGNIPTPPGRGG